VTLRGGFMGNMIKAKAKARSSTARPSIGKYKYQLTYFQCNKDYILFSVLKNNSLTSKVTVTVTYGCYISRNEAV